MLSAKWRPCCPGLNVLICINKVRLWHNCTIRSLMKPTCIYHTAFLHLNRIISTMAANLWLPRAYHNNTWWRHQMETFSALLAICAGNSPVPVNSPHKGHWRGALMFSLICVWINGWVNNREAGDLRRHRDHCDVIVMTKQVCVCVTHCSSRSHMSIMASQITGNSTVCSTARSGYHKIKTLHNLPSVNSLVQNQSW